MELAAGRRWRFRYLLDGARWENDWAADDYVANEFGGEDSVVELSAFQTPPPAEPRKPSRRTRALADEESAVEDITATTATTKNAAAKKAATKKATAKKAATTTTETPAKDLTKNVTGNRATAKKPAAKKAATPHEAPADTATTSETAEE